MASDWTCPICMPSNSNSENSVMKYAVHFRYFIYSALDVDADSPIKAKEKVKEMLEEHGLAVVKVEESDYLIDFVEEIE